MNHDEILTRKQKTVIAIETAFVLVFIVTGAIGMLHFFAMMKVPIIAQ